MKRIIEQIDHGDIKFTLTSDGTLTITPANGIEGTSDTYPHLLSSKNLSLVKNIETTGTLLFVEGGCESLFSCMDQLQHADLSHFDTRNATHMKDMFYGCNSLSTLDLSHFDTRNVTNMRGMFADCQALQTLDVSHFNTSSVTKMRGMFYGRLPLPFNPRSVTLRHSQRNEYARDVLWLQLSPDPGRITLRHSQRN